MADRPTSFVGRTRDLHILGERLSGAARLVTVVGPPGIGKTRLVTRFLLGGGAFESPHVFCDLREATDAAGLMKVVASALSVATLAPTSEDAAGELGRHMSRRGEMLIVLDNFEQLVPVAAPVLAEWFRAAPRAKFLVTSRRALRIEGEHLHELLPLSLPKHEGDETGEALQLLCDRLASEEPAVNARQRQSGCLSEIVRRLEGIPLAIEMAASQLTRCDAATLLDQLPRRTLSLRSGLAPTDLRHATMLSAVEGSWNLLAPRERAAFKQLSVFRTGFDPEAARAVVDLSDFPGCPDIEEVVAALRSQSFLHVVEGVRSLRWDSYGVQWEYVRGSLVRGTEDEAAVRSRHAAYFSRFAKSHGARLSAEDGVEARAALTREEGNLRAAFAWMISLPDEVSWGRASDVARGLHPILKDDRPAESVDQLTRLLEWNHAKVSSTTRARLLVARAEASRVLGRLAAAESDLEEARSLASGDDGILAELELGRGFLRFYEGKLSSSMGALRSALKHARCFGDPHLEGYVHYTLAVVLAQGFQALSGLEHAERAVSLLRRTGDLRAELYARVRVCTLHVYLLDTDVEQALCALRPAVDQLDNPRIDTLWHQTVGLNLLNQRRFSEAQRVFEQAGACADRSGMTRYLAYATAGVAIALDGQSEHHHALRAYEEAIDLFECGHDSRNQGAFTVLMGGLLARQDRVDEARNALARGKAVFSSCEDVSYRRMGVTVEGLVCLAEARRAQKESRPATWHDRLDAGVQLLEQSRGERRDDSASDPAHPGWGCSPAERFVHWAAQEDLARTEGDRTLAVRSDGSAFRIGMHPCVELPKGPVIRSFMRALVHQRKVAPLDAMSPDDLRSHGWPGEKIRPDAAARRVHAVIYRLRKAGLDGVLVTTDDGAYRLDPAIPLREMEAETQGM